jgi:hypothetical protein
MKFTPAILGTLATTLGLVALPFTPAQAALIGDDISCLVDSGLGTLVSPTVVTVGAGPDCTHTSSVDISADFFESAGISFLEVVVSNISGAPLPIGDVTFLFQDLDWVGTPGAITGITTIESNFLDTITGTTANSVFANVALAEMAVGQSNSATFSLDVEHLPPVPEPLTILGSLAALGIGSTMKHKMSKSQNV